MASHGFLWRFPWHVLQAGNELTHMPALCPLIFPPHSHLPLCSLCLCICLCYFHSLHVLSQVEGLAHSLLFLLSSSPKESLLPKTFPGQQCKTVALPASPHISISCVIPSVTLLPQTNCIMYCFFVHLLHLSTCILEAKLFLFYGHCTPKSRVGLLHSRQSRYICTRIKDTSDNDMLITIYNSQSVLITDHMLLELTEVGLIVCTL